jgi:adiponectin receptor
MSYSSACTTSVLTESREEPTLGATSGLQLEQDLDRARKRRRHSSYQPRNWSSERENVQVLVDRFLVDLGRRLEMIETYGHLKIDETMNAAYHTLHAVHHSCTQVSDDIMDAGRRRAKVLVETMETRYKNALAQKETLEGKVKEGVKLAEGLLTEFEKRAYDLRKAGLVAAAHDMLDTGKAIGKEAMENASHKAADIMNESAEAARRAKEALKLRIEEAVTLARTQGLITYEILPEPWRVNPHIRRGYRFSENKLECVKSCFTTFSNETVNIWTHGIGLIIVLAIAFYFYPISPAFTNATKFDIFIAGCFFFAAAKCLVCSCMWHTMNAISNQTLLERFACVDYTGISLLVAASIMTTEYTAFYCEPVSRWVYLSLTFVLGISGSILPWHPTVIQLTLERGWPATAYFYAPISKSMLVYFSGAILYAAKVPERWLPGAFDYVGGSHNIWHMAVLGGILFHYSAMQAFFREAFARAEMGGCSVY